jgi:hypothetical protein
MSYLKLWVYLILLRCSWTLPITARSIQNTEVRRICVEILHVLALCYSCSLVELHCWKWARGRVGRKWRMCLLEICLCKVIWTKMTQSRLQCLWSWTSIFIYLLIYYLFIHSLIHLFVRPINSANKVSLEWTAALNLWKVKYYLLLLLLLFGVSRDSAVCIATGYGLDDREVGVRVPVGSRIFTCPCRPDRLWGAPNLLYNGYRGLFPEGKAAGAWSWPLTSN